MDWLLVAQQGIGEVLIVFILFFGCRRARFVNSFGLLMALDPSEYIDSHIIKTGYYEREVLDSLVSNLRSQSDVVWDIGANTGLHGLTMSFAHSVKKTYFFEPNPVMVQVLQWQSQANSLEHNIEIFSCGLSDIDGNAMLFLHKGNSGMSSLVDWRGTATRSLNVQLQRADTLIQSAAALMPNIIKIDVEGNELSVLKGFGSYLAHPSLRVIIFEDGRADQTPVKAYLREHRFRISSPLVRHEISQLHGLENHIAIKG